MEEFELVEESLLQYYGILTNKNPEDEVVNYELQVLRGLLTEFGHEVEVEEARPMSQKRSVLSSSVLA